MDNNKLYCTFEKDIKFISYKNASKYSFYLFSGNFTCNNKAKVKIACAKYAEVYINSVFAFRMCERSYIFDLYYKVVDISKYIKDGINTISILYQSSGEIKSDGLAFRIYNDKNEVIFESSKHINSGKFAPLSDNVSFFIEAQTKKEIYDSHYEQNIDGYAKSCENTIEIDINDTTFEKMHYSNIDFPDEKNIRCHIFPSIDILIPDDKKAYKVSNELGFGIYYTYLKETKTKKAKIYFSDNVKVAYYGKNIIKNGDDIEILSNQTPLYFVSSPFDLYIKGINRKCIFSFIPLLTKEIKRPFFPWNDPVSLDSYPLEYIEDKVSKNDIKSICEYSHISEKSQLLFANYIANKKLTALKYSSNIRNKKIPYLDDDIIVISKSTNKQSFIVDFEKVIIGSLHFDCYIEEGNEIDYYTFEGVNEYGFNIMSERNSGKYIITKNHSSYISHVRRGFRYVLFVIPENTKVTISNIGTYDLSYPIKNKYTFSCSDDNLNKIYKMSIDSVSSCTLDTYVDCPGYEQNPWTGDAFVTSCGNLLNFGNYDMDKHYHYLIAESISDGLTKYYRTNNPRYISKKFLPCACFPTYPEGNIPVWSFMWMLNVLTHFYLTNDIQFLEEIMPTIETTFSRCEKLLSKRHLLSIDGAWNLIEWANNDLDKCGEVIANNILLCECLKRYSIVEQYIGNLDKSHHYELLYKKIKRSINKYGFDQNRKAYTDMVRDEYAYNNYKEYYTKIGKPILSFDDYKKLSKVSVQTNTLAYLFDIAPKKYTKYITFYLIDNIKTGNFVPGTPANCNLEQMNEHYIPSNYVHIGSPFFLFFAYFALEKLGKTNLIYKSLSREYMNMLKDNITTTTETFNIKGYKKTRSNCHSWSSSPSIFFKTMTLGVIPLEPGFKTFIIKPNLGNLEYAKGTVPTPYGDINVDISKDKYGKLDIKCECPKEIKRIDNN